MAAKGLFNKDWKIPVNFFKYLWLLVIAGALVLSAIFVIISMSQIPDTRELENPSFEVASLVLDDESDGKIEEIGRYFKFNRDWLTFEEINPRIIEALVATEDERFFQHIGIDVRGFLRAAVYLGKRGGASTITQQLAKQFFTNYSRNFPTRVWQKLKEWVIAIEFEKRHTKEEILAMYLNKYDFLYNANGISAAARTYFGKDQNDLLQEEASVLVAMLKNPSIYNPKKFPENALKRRNVVMNQMVVNGYLEKTVYDSLKLLPLDISGFMKSKNYSGPAPYFRAELTKFIHRTFEEKGIRKPDGTKYNIYTDGLKIYTTVDLNMQRHAETSMKEHMKTLQETYFRRWKNKDPWTYKADKEEKKIRQNNLKRLVENTERYKLLKSRILGKVLTKLNNEHPNFTLVTRDMIRMENEEKEPGHLDDIVKKKWTTKDRAKVYKSILKSDYWSQLKSDWNTFQKTMTVDFKTPKKMKVFAYNDAGYEIVTMSPLDSIKYHEMHLRFGSLSVDPQTGFIKTWVGGIGYDYFKYDHIQQSNNQIGSTFKPFVYTVAIKERGISPCQKVMDQQYTIPAGDPDFGLLKTWAPSNSSGFSGEMVTLKDGLRKSLNSVSVYLMKEIGNTEAIRDYVGNLGIDKNKIPNAPSICLGSADLTVMDMAGAYTTYANNGQYSKPIFVKKIEDKNGRVIYNYQPEQKKVLNPVHNFALVQMLKYVVEHRAAQFKSEIAGKTGTTNDHVDGWFIGFTPNLVSATWVGGAERWIRFETIEDGQGAVMARPYFEKFLKKIENDQEIDFDTNVRFQVPEGDNLVIDCTVYDQLAEQLERKDLELKKNELDEEFDEEF
jgi:penicillin-binding protein 1A